jgi:flagellar basal-body rod protein FlgB
MSDWLNTPIFNLLESGLNGLGLRQKVLADNIANNDTPGFKRSDVNFEKYLQAAVKSREDVAASQEKTALGKIVTAGISPQDFVERDESTSFRNDKNNVDIDLEMTRLAENNLHYNALITMLTSHLTILKGIVRG